MGFKGSLFRKFILKRKEEFLSAEMLGIIPIRKEELKTETKAYSIAYDAFTIKNVINMMKTLNARKRLFNKAPKLKSHTSFYHVLTSDYISFVIITEEIVNNDLIINNCTEFLHEMINEPNKIIQKIKEKDTKELYEEQKEDLMKGRFPENYVFFKQFRLLKEFKNMYIALGISFKDTDEITENYLKNEFQRTLEFVRKNIDFITQQLNKQLIS